jgi:hypothetical protein
MESKELNDRTFQDRSGRFGQVLAQAAGLAAFLALMIVTFGIQARIPAPGESANGELQPVSTPDLLLAQSLSEKEAIAARFAASIEAGKRTPGSRLSIQAAPDLPFSADPPFQEGIRTGEPGPFSADQLFVENLWQVGTDTGYLQVYAGALGVDLKQGVVVVLLTGLNRAQGVETWIQTPSPTGAVRIVAADGLLLTLNSTQGEQYLFDVEERQFIKPDK